MAEPADERTQPRAQSMGMATSTEGPPSRGDGLEDLLAEPFDLNEITRRRSYRTETEPIDGQFECKGFDRLAEARWQEGVPDRGRPCRLENGSGRDDHGHPWPIPVHRGVPRRGRLRVHARHLREHRAHGWPGPHAHPRGPRRAQGRLGARDPASRPGGRDRRSPSAAVLGGGGGAAGSWTARRAMDPDHRCSRAARSLA